MPLLADATLEAEVLAAARGDRDAFSRLIAATSGLVTAITLAETRDAELARDAAQDVYLQVWSGLGQLRRPGSFLPWLRQAARRQARRLSAQRSRRARGPEAEAALEAAADTAPGPRERLLDAERAALVRAALEALPDDARETLILYYREGHSSAQVARLLGLSDAAVQQRLSRARARLREEVLQRLGEAVARTAPAAGFTAAVTALLLPRTAAAATGHLAGGQLTGGLAAALQLPKALLAAGAAVLASLAFLFLGGPFGSGGGGPPTVTIARPAGERPPSEPPRTTPAVAAPPVAEGGLEIRVTIAGRPVPGAMVRAYAYVQVESGTARPSWRLLAAATAGADGTTRVAASPGAYLVAARAPGFAAAQVKVVRPGGEPVTRVAVALEPAVALVGRTIDRAEGPVPLAALVLWREAERGAPAAEPPPEERVYAASDPRGAFRVDGLSPGRWQLTAEAAGHARTTVAKVVLPRATPLDVRLGAAGVIEGLVVTADGNPARGAEVRFAGGPELTAVESGPTGGFAAEVAPGSYRVCAVRGDEAGWVERAVLVAPGATAGGLVIRLGTASRFAGKVVDGKGGPVGGALVLITPHAAEGEVARVVSAADGAFRSSPLAPGEYDVAASAPTLASASFDGLVLMPSQRFDLTLTLRETGRIEGRVRGSGGEPLQGIRVRGGVGWGSAFGEVRVEAVTDAEGRYRLSGIRPGAVGVTARRGDASLGSSVSVEVKAGEVATADFTLASPGLVDGRISMADGSPLPTDLEVTFRTDQNGNWSDLNTLRATVDADGRFRATLPAGAWKAMSWNPAAAVKSKGWSTVEVLAGATAHLELVLERKEREQVTLRLTVLEPNGAPAGRARYQLYAPPEAGIMSMTSDEGIAEPYLAFPGLETARLLVTATKGGRRAVLVPIPPGAREATIQLEAAARLTGTIDAGGAPIAGFTLRVEYPSLPPFSTGQVEERRFAGDTFLLADAPPGDATVVAITDDGRSGRATVQLRPGETSEVKLAVAPGGRLRARILDTDGQPNRQAYLVVGGKMVDAALDGRDFDPANVEGGALIARDLPAGPAELELGARCFERQRRTVTIQAGQTLDLGDVTLKPLSPAACGR